MTELPVPLIIRRVISSSRERVFDAFTNSAALTQWFTPSPDVSIEVLTFEFVVGGQFRFRYSMAGGRKPVVHGVYEAIEPPSRIVMSWIWEAPDELANIPMRVAFTFERRVEATEVVVTHEGIPSDLACTVHEDGWDGSFTRLQQYMDSGHTDQHGMLDA